MKSPGRLVAAMILPTMLVVLGGTPAQAADDAAACTQPDDVTVVVDFQGLDREDAVSCAPGGAGKSAAALIEQAGVDVAGTTTYPDAIICRVDGLPDAAAEPCSDMPSADAYWTLWWSDGSKGAWDYAQEGAATLKVPGGGFVGLSFQEGQDEVAPSLAPVAATQELTAAPADEAADDTDADDSSSSASVWVAGILAVVLVVAIVVVVIRRRAADSR